jgi:2-phosphosulfolactate phosphatase
LPRWDTGGNGGLQYGDEARPVSAPQAAYRIRFERGESGLRAIAAGASTIVIVDVLSFSTAVDVAVSAGTLVKAMPPERAAEEAARLDALCAVSRDRRSVERPYSLSPDTLSDLTPGARLILPSPNGATLVAIAQSLGASTVATSCLRNAAAVSGFIRERDQNGIVAVVAAGECWPDGSLRPALEDDLGAGALLAGLDLEYASPEALLVAQSFSGARERFATLIEASTSGRELIESGYAADVERAVEYNRSRSVPVVDENGYLRNAVPMGF